MRAGCTALGKRSSWNTELVVLHSWTPLKYEACINTLTNIHCNCTDADKFITDDTNVTHVIMSNE